MNKSIDIWIVILSSNEIFRLDYFFYLSHTQLHREYITSSEMYSLHLTHPKWTHTRSSGQPCYSARGAVGPCSRTPQSWHWRRILPPPTIPAGPEIRTHNLPLTSSTRYPLGHDCPKWTHKFQNQCSKAAVLNHVPCVPCSAHALLCISLSLIQIIRSPAQLQQWTVTIVHFVYRQTDIFHIAMRSVIHGRRAVAVLY